MKIITLKVKDLKEILKQLDDEAEVGIRFNGCKESGETMGVTDIYIESYKDLAIQEGWGNEDDKFNEEEKMKCLIFYSNRKNLW